MIPNFFFFKLIQSIKKNLFGHEKMNPSVTRFLYDFKTRKFSRQQGRQGNLAESGCFCNRNSVLFLVPTRNRADSSGIV